MNDANNAGIDAALKAIEDLRISGAGNFFDPKYAGQRGIDLTGPRRKRYFMYKHVMGTRTLRSGTEYAVFDHLDLDGRHYLRCDGRSLPDVEIVQSVDAKFEERPRSLRARAQQESKDA